MGDEQGSNKYRAALTSAIVRPSVEAWAALPRRARVRREGTVAWLIGLLTTVGAFVADRGWESFDDPAWTGAYRVVDMFGLASIALALSFSVFGLLVRRYAPLAAPLVLSVAAIPHTLDGYASAVVWWSGAAVAALWAVNVAARSWHRLRAVRRLAQASLTGRTTTVGPNAVRAVDRTFRRGVLRLLLFLTVACGGWALAFGVLPTELGRTYEELGDQSGSNVFAAAGIAASIMTVTEAVRQGWRVLALGQVGRRLVWEIPAGHGVPPWWPYARNDAGTVPIEAAEAPGCNCLAEFRRAYAEDEGNLRVGEGVPASYYCPAHGIDRINELTAEEFIAMSEETWLWESGSHLPEPADPDAKRLLLYGFAGHTFGGIPVRKLRGRIDADFPGVRPAHEAGPEDFGPWWDNPLRPAAGVQDSIDLQPAGYTGSAFRYRHGRAWFEAAPPFIPESEP